MAGNVISVSRKIALNQSLNKPTISIAEPTAETNVDSSDERLSEIYGMYAFEYDGMYIGVPHIYRHLNSELNAKYKNDINITGVSIDSREIKENGMFIAIIIPPARENIKVTFAIILSISIVELVIIYSYSILSVEYAGNIVVIKTYPGLAQAIAAVLDSSHIKGVMGCVAGDDTIFMLCRTADEARGVAEALNRMIGR